MNPTQIDDAIAGADMVPAAEQGLVEAKRLVERLLAEDIPAVLSGKDCCGGGCSPKARVLVRRDDLPRLAAFLERDWTEALQREGTLNEELLAKLRAAATATDEDAEPPCPACGTAAPLVDGACSDCGLQLA